MRSWLSGVLHCTANILHCVLYKWAIHFYDLGCFCDACLSGFALILNSTIRTIVNMFISLSLCLWQADTGGGGLVVYRDRMSFTLHCAGGMETEPVQMEAISNWVLSVASCLKDFVSVLQLSARSMSCYIYIYMEVYLLNTKYWEEANMENTQKQVFIFIRLFLTQSKCFLFFLFLQVNVETFLFYC